MNTNRRAWVKNAMIIFLTIMLILTFFSNTIMNYSLPEVAAQYTQSGSITSKIRTSASVTANSKQKVVIDESRTVLSVPVREGDDVKAGDVLVYLTDEESSQLVSARQSLAQLEKQYQLKQLVSPNDYYDTLQQIAQKKEDIAKTQKNLEKLKSGQLTATTADMEALKAQITTVTEQQKALSKEIESYTALKDKLKLQAAEESLPGDDTVAVRLSKAQAAYAAAQTAFQNAEALKNSTAADKEAADAAYTAAKKAYESLNLTGASAASVQEQIDSLNKTITRYKEDNDFDRGLMERNLARAERVYERANEKFNKAESYFIQGDLSVEDYEAAIAEFEDADYAYQTAVNANQPQIRAYDRQMEDYNEQLAKLQSQLDTIINAETYKSAYDNAAKVKETADTAAETAAADYEKKKAEYDTAKTELSKLDKRSELEECEMKIAAMQKEQETYASQLEELQKKKSEAEQLQEQYTSDIKNQQQQEEQLQEQIENLRKSLETLQHNYEKQLQEDSLSAQREAIETEELLENIAKQRELVAKYEANSTNAKILAEIDGQVSNLTVVAGSETSVGQTLCEIVVTELGYSCELNLTTEQAKRVRVGDEVTVSNTWWSNIKAVVSNVRNDPKNPGQSKIATVAVTGDVTVGQTLNLTIGERGQTYDTVIPNSAVREDNNGKFVLTVEAKSSPLGNRYIAKRTDITVIASDDTNSAVSGLLGSEFVITTSTKPIAAGTQVRMAEN